jgi:tRNA 5-methylaminomethyl-2-thiouridine biosynthesis bifunctional protein
MPDTDFAPVTVASIDWQHHTPVAPAYDDPYFSREDGAGETRHVFIDGNQLIERFSRLPEHGLFVIGETGFGTGLNFLCAAQHFLQHAPEHARLHYLSTEKHPLTPHDLIRALSHWPDPHGIAAELQQIWPAATAGFHRRELAQSRISLTLMHGDSVAMLKHTHSCVDAWFLDGFAPARNPDMWQPALFEQLRRLSRPGATLATFTAAGFVRRGLQDAGFTMQRVPGFGRKRDMLTGHVPGQWEPAHRSPPSVVVIGAGLAGATCARALARQGAQVTVVERTGIASAASGNLAGVVYTTPSAHPTAQNRFYQSSYLHALAWLAREQFPTTANDGALNGVAHYPKDARMAEKASAALDSGHWPKDQLDAPGGAPGALHFVRGGYLSPARWCRTLLAHPNIRVLTADVDSIQYHTQWQTLQGDTVVAEAEHIILANSFDALKLASVPALKLKRIRGQVSYVRATDASHRWQQAICHAGYLTPAIGDLHCVGATFDLHNPSPVATAEDDHANLDELKQQLPDYWRALGGDHCDVVDHRVGFRCQSTDFMPIAGPVPNQPAGVWLSIAHGSRGISGTPICADLLAAQILDLPLPMDNEMVDALAPARFMLRDQLRSRRPS